jgi:hypothetical protein
MNKDQKKLEYVAQRYIKPKDWPSLRGVMAKWEGETLQVAFFFDKKISETVRENASILASEIIAQYPEGFLKEDYILISKSQTLPQSEFWIYKRDSLV